MGVSRALDAQERQWLELVRHVLASERPRAAEVAAAAAEYADAAALIEALATRDVIPARWLDDPAARFGVPLDRGLILALAGDPAGVARAEALALECAARCVPWGAAPATAVRWRPVARDAAQCPAAAWLPGKVEARLADQVFASYVEAEKKTIVRSVERAARSVSGRKSDDHSVGSPTVAPDDPPWRARMWDRGAPGDTFLRQLTSSRVWAVLAGRGVAVDRTPRGAPEKIKGRPYAEMASPFAALVELWATGYYATSLDGPVLELCAPAL